MQPNGNSNGTARLDRIEHALELLIHDHVQFREEHKQLLTSQVLLTGQVDKLALTMKELAEAQRATDERLKELVEAQRSTDERLNALIGVVDGIVRQRPNQA